MRYPEDHIDSTMMDRDDPELEKAWATFEDPVEDWGGDCWQYTHSWKNKEEQWFHSFRHRAHPIENMPVRKEVPASEGWEPGLTPEQVAARASAEALLKKAEKLEIQAIKTKLQQQNSI